MYSCGGQVSDADDDDDDDDDDGDDDYATVYIYWSTHLS